uniref:Uncharacterized protein n=1 Tax=Lotus japonicus TaxID=34305 RepID=I3RZJ7_LOTJA|nr:unknown [Lotus japonicus]
MTTTSVESVKKKNSNQMSVNMLIIYEAGTTNYVSFHR